MGASLSDDSDHGRIRHPHHLAAAQGQAEHQFVAPFLAMFAVVFPIPIVVSVYQSFFRDVAPAPDLYGGGRK